jgi:hypothetical protein
VTGKSALDGFRSKPAGYSQVIKFDETRTTNWNSTGGNAERTSETAGQTRARWSGSQVTEQVKRPGESQCPAEQPAQL